MTQTQIVNTLARGLQMAVVGAAILTANPSDAAIIGGKVTGGARGNPVTTVDIVKLDPPPTLVANNAIESQNLLAFNERQNIILSQDVWLYSVFDTSVSDQIYDLSISDPDIFVPTGTRVSSHFIFLDPVPVIQTSWRGEVTFDQKILGIIADERGEFGFIETNELFGLENTAYSLRGRRLDGTQDLVSFEKNVLSFDVTTVQGMDPIRVITLATPVPEPLTILGTGTALGIAPLLKKAHSRKQKKHTKAKK
jgi:hypothetical protein